MRSKTIVGVLALSATLVLWAATPSKKSRTAGTTKTVAKTSTAKGSKSKQTKAAAGKKSTTAKTTAARYRRSTQKEPAPERYKEIQQSLADKGYFAGTANGAWGSDSVEALKRFQRDQNIGDDGKLGSLSLIALGLGPKRGPEKSENSESSPTPP